MTIGLIIAAGLFVACALVARENALWIPALLLVAAAAANILL